MTVLRLLADDLTGALDSAARFVPLVGPVPVMWSDPPPTGTVAIDSETRDLDPETAEAVVRRLVSTLGGADIAFKKIDGLLRGSVVRELAVCLPHFDHCILAPAFPFQGRITQSGRQLAWDGTGWRDTSIDLSALPVPLLDARTDADLDAIVAQGRALPGRVLWVGTGGLAGALAGRNAVPSPGLRRPILALAGSRHPATLGQLEAAEAWHRPVTPGAIDPPMLPAIVTVNLPPDTPATDAAARIAATFRTVLTNVPRPGTLLIIGGATLHAVCQALGATSLLVDGEVEPGVPLAILRGGAWDGQRIVSKSGAFGDKGLLVRLMRG